MSHRRELPPGAHPDAERDSVGDAVPSAADLESSEAVRRWLQRWHTTSGARLKTPNLLPGVQRRIRQRSRGKFFRDGWSTATTRTTPAILAVITVGLIALAYYAMTPWPIR